jgi:DNA polymerase-1
MSDDAPSRLPPAADPHTLYVVDISGYLFRAYHALPPLNSEKGEPTGAVLGVTTMLLRLLQDQRPALFAVALDSPGAGFRAEMYTDYKAHRPPMPPDLIPQVARMHEMIEAYRFPVFRMQGAEADDVIATLTQRALSHGMKVVIVSSDKDLMQLVREGVSMFDTMRNVVFGPAEVEAKLGVKPEQVRDYLALVGDSVDNVPGVPSVGPKTAVSLLAQFGDLDALFANLEQVEKKGVRQKLTDHRDAAFLSRQLVSLKDDLALDPGREALSLPEPDEPRLRALFAELGFTRLLSQLNAVVAETRAKAGVRAVAAPAAARALAPMVAEEASGQLTLGGTVGGGGAVTAQLELGVRAEEPAAECEVVSDAAALVALVKSLAVAERFALLTLMEGAHPVSGTLVGLAFGLDERAVYVPLAYAGAPAQLAREQVLKALAPVLADPKVAKVSANAKREMEVLSCAGLELAGVRFDSMLASYLIDPEKHSHSLIDVARFELGISLSDGEKRLLEHRLPEGTLAGQSIEHTAGSAGTLVRAMLQARAVLEPKLEAIGCAPLLHEMELPLSVVLSDMERTGVAIDTAHLGALGKTVDVQLVELEAKCRVLAGRDFNVGSPRQLEAILFDELKLPVIKRTKTARSTDHSVLEELAPMHELPAAILEHRILAKLKSTYLEALPAEINPKTGRIHTDFRQAVAATGRLSSTEPNLQNIPIRTEIGRSIRDAFVARDGHEILSADYSQIELRVLAHLSGDKELTDAFRAGTDVHTRTARAIFGVDESMVTREMRGQSKTVNYAVIYGQTQFALARNLRIERGQAARYIKAFFEQYAGVAAYMQNIVAEAAATGEVRTLFGRIRKLPDLQSKDRVRRQAAERVARNTPIQGSAADIIKRAMIAIHRALVAQKLESKMLLTVHDELVFEAPVAEKAQLEKLVVDCMESAADLSVPLVADRGWGESWGKAH